MSSKLPFNKFVSTYAPNYLCFLSNNYILDISSWPVKRGFASMKGVLNSSTLSYHPLLDKKKGADPIAGQRLSEGVRAYSSQVSLKLR